MRWLYHAVLVGDNHGDPYRPKSLEVEGFIHCSFAPSVADSVALYFAPDSHLVVLQIDPRRLRVPVHIDETPRGPMPHLLGPLHRDAVTRTLQRSELWGLPDLTGVSTAH